MCAVLSRDFRLTANLATSSGRRRSPGVQRGDVATPLDLPPPAKVNRWRVSSIRKQGIVAGLERAMYSGYEHRGPLLSTERPCAAGVPRVSDPALWHETLGRLGCGRAMRRVSACRVEHVYQLAAVDMRLSGWHVLTTRPAVDLR